MTEDLDHGSSPEVRRAGQTRDAYRGEASPFGSRSKRSLLYRISPVSEDLSHYRGRTFRRDLVAGVTVAALAVP